MIKSNCLVTVAFGAAMLLSSVAHAQGSCGPGTSDPNCNAHNAQREANLRAEAARRNSDDLKRNGTYGRHGERSTPSNAVNDSSRGRTISR
jgi:hypothetical protein